MTREDGNIENDYVPTLNYTGRHCEILLKTATPQLYRENAFRILDLPVNVTLRAIERHQQKLKIVAKLGINSHDQNHSYLPLASSPSGDSIKNAIERLHDPQKRLIDWFFWFWPTQTDLRHDKAFDLLTKRRVKEALKILEENAEAGCCVSAHNLAVLYHAHALDIECKSMTKSLEEEELKFCGLCWKGAYKQWQKLLKNKIFWSQVTTRIRDINDPLLTTEIAKQMHYSLPKALFQINVQLAKCAAEKNDKAICNYHIQLVNELADSTPKCN